MTSTNNPQGLKKFAVNALKAVLSLLLIAAGVAVFLLLGKSETRPKNTVDKPIPSVEVALVKEHTAGVPFDVDGIVVPFRQVEVAAEVSGRIIFKDDKFRVGRTVRKGNLLLRIDPSDFELEIQRLKQELAQAIAVLSELDVQIDISKNKIILVKEDLGIRKRELERYSLIKDPGVFSQVELDTARRNELAGRNALQTEQDQLRKLGSTRLRLESVRELVKANLEKANLNLARCKIRAPLSGIIVQEEVEQDEYIQQGSSVVLLQDTSKINVACKLYMSQMQWLWQANGITKDASSERMPYDFPETPVEVVYDLGPVSFVWDGVLQRYEGAGVDGQTRMVPCLVHVANPLKARRLDNLKSDTPPTLMTGMFVEVRIRAKPSTPMLSVPHSAVQPGNTIWVVRNKKLFSTTARLAGHDGDSALIYATDVSPRPGDKVVISPLAAPTPGQQVEIEVPK